MKIPFAISTNFSMTLAVFSMMLFSAAHADKINFSQQIYADTEPQITICHATNAVKNPYVSITVDQSSVDGVNSQGDHYLEHDESVFTIGMTNKDDWGDIIPPIPGIHAGLNWASGEAIYNNGCKVPGLPVCEETIACPTQCGYEGGEIEGECGPIECGATRSCEEVDPCEENPELEECQEPTPTPTATPTPSVTPTATPTPENPNNESSKLWVEHLACDQYDFRAEMDLKTGDNPVQDVLVTFTYNGLSKNAYTNKDGRASTSFTFTGEAVVKATPNNGFATQETKATAETNCQEMGAISTPVSTPASSGQVLGANTYAETGVFEDVLMSIVGLSGATMTSVGAMLHAKKKN